VFNGSALGTLLQLLPGDERRAEGGEKRMSNQEAMQQLADRFVNDAEFREQMRQDPEETARRSGLNLDEEDRQALRSIGWGGSDEDLKERVSKYKTRWC
jgi:hypothetical protein